MSTLFIRDFLFAFVALFPMVNPIAMSAIFLSMTRQATDSERNKLSRLVAIYGAILLVMVLLIGPFILNFFGLQVADIRVAGGLVVAFIAWQMLMGSSYSKKEAHQHSIDSTDLMNEAFFPLTMPITAGAGSIAITITLATQAAQSDLTRADLMLHYLAIAAAIVVVFVIVYICYRFASDIFRLLGKAGSKVVSQLSAFILLAIGVNMVWSGVRLMIGG